MNDDNLSLRGCHKFKFLTAAAVLASKNVKTLNELSFVIATIDQRQNDQRSTRHSLPSMASSSRSSTSTCGQNRKFKWSLRSRNAAKLNMSTFTGEWKLIKFLESFLTFEILPGKSQILSCVSRRFSIIPQARCDFITSIKLTATKWDRKKWNIPTSNFTAITFRLAMKSSSNPKNGTAEHQTYRTSCSRRQILLDNKLNVIFILTFSNF